jgi:hypothetical protein
MLRMAFRDHSSSQTVVFEWQTHFKVSQVSAEDDKR